MTREFTLVLAASFAALTSFYLLLSVVPQYAATAGAGSTGAGLATGALFFSTTLTELVTPRLVARGGYRLVFAAGLALLGVPALALGSSSGMTAISVICALRGMGLAIVVVVGSALVGFLAPPQRRAEALGLYGVVAGVPAVVALPLGLWLVSHLGYGPVFITGAVTALVGLAPLPGLKKRRPQPEPTAGVFAALTAPALLFPAFVFLTTATAAGVLVTFVPLAAPQSVEDLAPLALLLFGAASTLSRWWAGLHADRHPSHDLLRPSAALVGLGMACLCLIDRRTALLAATALVGTGFGIAQNASIALMFDVAPLSEFESVSAVWNLAYDAGLGAGGAGFGVLVVWTGYPGGFALTAVFILAALTVVWRSRHLVPLTAVPSQPGIALARD
jgi:predicted MFS family arabinose efflux permease